MKFAVGVLWNLICVVDVGFFLLGMGCTCSRADEGPGRGYLPLGGA